MVELTDLLIYAILFLFIAFGERPKKPAPRPESKPEPVAKPASKRASLKPSLVKKPRVCTFVTTEEHEEAHRLYGDWYADTIMFRGDGLTIDSEPDEISAVGELQERLAEEHPEWVGEE